MNPLFTLFLFLFVGLPVAVPFILLARFARAYPSWPLVAAASIPAVASLVGLVLHALNYDVNLLVPLLFMDGLILLVAAADFLTLPRKKDFSVERTVGRIASLRTHHPVSLTVSHFGNATRRLRVKDDVPNELVARPAQFQAVLKGRSRAVLKYDLWAERRGAFELPICHLAANSRLGLWTRFLTHECESVVHVYPDMKQVSQYAMLARLNRLSMIGVRKTRKVGGDNEFERLRDYTRDDNYKHIDWKSTARRGKLTVKQFQSEQSQRVIFMLDCGRMMTNEAAGLSLLDHSLNAMLMLSYVALSHGDQVGLLTFSDEVHGFVPPGSGRGHINRLLHESFNRFPRFVESRYDRAFLYLGAHCQKRSLVILISNVIDEVNGNQIEQYLGTLVGRHLPVGVLLRDRQLF
ncbi:MAG: DUF58 domain-containing protein, partial [Planctomycetales bacterium]